MVIRMDMDTRRRLHGLTDNRYDIEMELMVEINVLVRVRGYGMDLLDFFARKLYVWCIYVELTGNVRQSK